ncbi:hypothetical protein RR48_00920 [Papilio machaon]|uniref:Uncharacterized protein n=1 Tax=Papilio machaon TaxID=76193 RepID=A0A0N0PDD8_PAPMA|nr:hypothetical protein RR48_00920 [Papilio machaon]
MGKSSRSHYLQKGVRQSGGLGCGSLRHSAVLASGSASALAPPPASAPAPPPASALSRRTLPTRNSSILQRKT